MSRSLQSAVLTVTLGFCFAAAPGQAQAPPSDDLPFQMGTGVGWAFTLPGAFLGIGGFHIFEDTAWGVHAEAKMTHDSDKRRRNFQEDLTVAFLELNYPEIRRDLIGERDEWLILNASIVRTITPELALMAGGGIARRSIMREYVDHLAQGEGMGELSDTGFYFVEDERNSGWEPNATVGALMRSSEHLAFTAGFEAASRSFILGAYLVLR